MIKIFNFIQLMEGVKVFLELIGMIYKGVQEVIQQCKSKSEKPNKTSDVTPGTNNPAEE